MGLARMKCCKKQDGSSEELPEKPIETENPNSVEGRAQWSSPTEFILTCVGYSVGLGNVWRFPYLCYKSGGGAFLIPYVIMMCLIGMPLLFMEYSFGQYFGVGGLTIFKKVCPMFQGVGVAYMVLNGLVCIYYNVIIAMSLYYLFASFTSDLPWGSCGHEWNTPACGDPQRPGNASMGNLTSNGSLFTPVYNLTATATMSPNSTEFDLGNMTRVSPSDEYFRLAVLQVDETHNIENLGEIRWHLCLCLLLAWILVILFVSRGIKSTGKVAYFTATFPYLMLTVLVIRGVTLEGASTGILFFVSPKWEKLMEPEVWFGAASQLFYSTNLAWGGMITMSSYSTFNHNCYRDAVMINLVSFFTSLYAGFAVFSIIGYMANEYGIGVDEVINSGPGLAFIVYPRALSLMPLAPMWSALFFFMLFLLGVGSQMVLMETVVTGLVDEYPVLGRNARIRLMTSISVAIFFMLFGLAQTTQMVQVETIMTGITDTFRQLGSSRIKRFLTVIVVCTCGFFLGLAHVTQMVDLETVMSGLCDEFVVLRKNRFKTLIVVSSVFFLLGLAQVTQMVSLETVMSGFCDEFAVLRTNRFKTLIVVTSVFFLLGLAQMTQGGMYVLQLMDWYSASFSVLIIAVVECFAINWVYGNARFGSNVKEMLGKMPGRWWLLCWKFVAPIIIVAILVFSFVKYKRAEYGDYIYPLWADFLGWCLVFAAVLPIFIIAVYKLVKAPGNSIREKYIKAVQPNLGPKLPVSSIEEKNPEKPTPNGISDDPSSEPLVEKSQEECAV